MNAKQLSALADELGHLKVQMADLDKREAEIKEKLIAAEVPAVEGSLFKALISRFSVTRTDYAGIVKHLDVPEKTLAKFRSEKDQVQVRVMVR